MLYACPVNTRCAGYPWIDATMRQLREWGWMHHLARHSVACFLTRGDLYISWEEGQAVFEELLIDAVSRCCIVWHTRITACSCVGLHWAIFISCSLRKQVVVF